MLSYFTKLVNWAKENLNDIFLVIGVVFVALASFGAGQIVAFLPKSQPIIIQEPIISPVDSSASIEQASPKAEQEPASQKMLVGSVNSDKYHWPDCPSAKKISPQNQIWFDSEKEAQAADYVPCGNFEKYTPASYSSE